MKLAELPRGNISELPVENMTEHLYELAYLRLTELPSTLIQNEFRILLRRGTEPQNRTAPAFLL